MIGLKSHDASQWAFLPCPLSMLPLLKTSKVTTSQWMPCISSYFLVPSLISSVRNWLEDESTAGASDERCRPQCPLIAD